ncbi:hypothetical protein [Arthrobacter sp. Ld5]|uniref:hypothetical protein n=1 Tax=Arthrobacter sp. Ld5 TaxID=649152 RepID=UPI003EBFE95D
MEYLPHILEHPTARLDEPALLGRNRRSLLPGILPGAATEVRQGDVPEDLGQVTTRRLRIVCNRTYQLLDEDRPPPAVRARYQAVVEELERREVLAEQSRAGDARSRAGDTGSRVPDAAVVLPPTPGTARRRLRLVGAAGVAGRDRR